MEGKLWILVMKIKAVPGDVDSASGLDGEKEDHERKNKY